MKSVLIYTSGDKHHGLGHVKRELVLAEELLSRGIRIGFEVPPDTVGYRIIKDWCVEHINVNVNDFMRLHDAIIIDLEHGPGQSLIEQARQKFDKVIVIGGVGFPPIGYVRDKGFSVLVGEVDAKRVSELVDLQIYQSIAVNKNEMPIGKNILIGCEYLIINKEYQSLRDVYGRAVIGHDVLVVMGGGDPHGLTGVVCEAAKICCNGNGASVRAVIGPAFDRPTTNRVLLPEDVKCFFAPPTLARAFASSRCAVSALGMTTYEAACVGVPTASISWSEDHVETAKKLEEANVTVNLGLWSNPDWVKMKEFVERMGDKNEWQKMSDAGRGLVNGLGVERVVERIERLL